MKPLTSMADEQLMERIAQGDKRAFDWLVRQHLPRAYAIARRVLTHAPDAEEAAQDAFTKLWVHAADWQPGKAKFSTWFYRIVTNAALDIARRRKLPTSSDETLLALLEDDTASIEERLSEDDERAAVREALDTLTPTQRAAVSLCYFEEMTNPEAAQAMGIHVKALEGLLVRARKTLRTALLAKKGDARHAA
jgi:RNA polymerase sigma-70 factor (ECF subfamily)